MQNNSTEYKKVLQYCYDILIQKQKEIPINQIVCLIAEVLKVDPLNLQINKDLRIKFKKKKKILKKFYFLLNKKPLSRIIGRKEFYSKDFFINKFTLDPRSDTETLVESVLKITVNLKKKNKIKILELGSGSGCVLSTVANELQFIRDDFKILGIDICDKALEVASKNVRKYKLEKFIKLLKSNWFSNIKGTFDVIYTNPPYVKSIDYKNLDPSVTFDPYISLFAGFDGLSSFKTIADQISPYLSKNGFFCTEIGFEQGQPVREIFENKDFEYYTSHKDLAGIDRCIVFHKK